MAFCLIKFECPLPRLFENSPLVLKRFLNVVNVFHHYLPLEEEVALHLNKMRGCFVPNFVEIGPVVLEKLKI